MDIEMPIEPGTIVWIDCPYEDEPPTKFSEPRDAGAFVRVTGKRYPAIVIGKQDIIDRRSLEHVATERRKKRDESFESVRIYRACRRKGLLVCLVQTREPWFSKQLSMVMNRAGEPAIRRFVRVCKQVNDQKESFVNMAGIVVSEDVAIKSREEVKQVDAGVLDQIKIEMGILALFYEGKSKHWRLAE